MNILDEFYIIATYPYNYCWNYGGELSKVHLDTFIYKNGYICSSNQVFYMKIKEDNVTFVDNIKEATKVEIERTSISVDYFIKYNGRFIRHKESKLHCDEFDGTLEFKKDATWIFYPKAYNPDHTFVIAKYKEDVSWTRYLPGKVIIYNKGSPMSVSDPTGKIQIINLPNIGREGHTYLYHIIYNYTKLSKRTTFLQGDPFDHSPHLLELTCMEDDYEDVQSLSVWYLNNMEKCIPAKDIIRKNYKTLNGAYYSTYKVEKSGETIGDVGYMHILVEYDRINQSGRNIIDHFLDRCGLSMKIRDKYTMIFSALFSAKKENIRKNSLSDYKSILVELLKNDIHGGREGYVLERCWYELLK